MPPDRWASLDYDPNPAASSAKSGRRGGAAPARGRGGFGGRPEEYYPPAERGLFEMNPSGVFRDAP